MAPDQFFEAGSVRVLTAQAFSFVFDGQLRRAVEAQNFLTLVVLEVQRDSEGLKISADDHTVDEMASVISHEVRDTDLIGKTEKGTLSLVLLDADFESSTRVIDRLVSQIDRHGFPTPLRVSIGAACYPTHAIDADSLTRQASSRPVINWPGARQPTSPSHH